MIHNNRTRSTLTTALDRAKLTMVAAVTALTLCVVDADADTVDIQNPNVVAGQASFNAAAHQWYITTGHRAIIEYSAFNIHNGGAVQFIQPNVSSAVLNRIISADPSSINGSLSANGGLFFVNPAGVTFGPNAVVNAGMFHAAAGKMSNSDFLNGVNRFTDLSGTITNLGSIQAGGVALLGQHVVNRGTIIAPESFITLAAADRVILAPDNSGIILQIHRDSSSEDAQTGVENTGVLKARGGHVTAAAGDFYSMAMDIEGTIVAEDIRIEGGDDSIVRVAATLDASGNSNNNNKGGYIQVTGEKVWLDNGARLNATGANGGGEILVGGDYQGKNSNIRNAWRTHVSQDVVLNASATQAGHGGKIIIWSDDFTNYFGTIKAKGAGYKGNGGFAEVSGKRNLAFNGKVNLKASRGGASGLLLLDPVNVTIVDGAADVDIDPDGGGTFTGFDEFNDNALTGQLSIASIIASLATNNVLIQAGTAADGETDAGNIVWNVTNATGTITGGNAFSLTLEAPNDITFTTEPNFGVWTGEFRLHAGDNITLDQPLDRSAFGGAITIRADFDGIVGIASDGVGTVTINELVNTGGSDLLITGADFVLDFAGNGVLNTGAGEIFLQASQDTAAYNVGNGGANFGVSNDELLDMTASGISIGTENATAGTIIIDGAIALVGATDLTIGGFDLDVDNGIALAAGQTLFLGASDDAAGSITFAAVNIDSDNIDLQVGNTNATILYNAATAFRDASGTVNPTTLLVRTNNIAAVNLTDFMPDNSNFLIAGNLAGTTITFENLGAGDIVNNIGDYVGGSFALVSTGGNIDAASAASAYGDLTLTTGGGNVTQTAELVLTGGGTHLDVDTDGGDITLTDEDNEFVTVALAGFTVAITDKDAINLDNTTVDSLTVETVDGGISATGVLDVETLSSFTAGGVGNIILLVNGANDFTGAVDLSADGAVSIIDSDGGIILDAVSTGDTLTVTTTNAGDITQFAGGTIVAGDATFTADTTGNIDLSLLNEFNGVVNLDGTNVTINDVDATGNELTLGVVTARGDLVVTTDNDGNIVSNAADVIDAALTASFDAGDGDITLGSANEFDGAVSLDGAAVTINDDNALTLGTVTAASLTVTTSNNGDILATGVVTMDAGGGQLSFNAGAGDITVNNGTNNLGTGAILLTGTNVAVTNAVGGVDLGASDIDGNFDLISAGAVTNSGTVVIDGVTTLVANGQSITLGGANTIDFQGTVSVDTSGVAAAGGNVNIEDVDDLTFTTIDTSGGAGGFIGGNVQLTTTAAGGGLLTIDDIDTSGGGNGAGAGGAGGSIQLTGDNDINVLGGAVITSGGGDGTADVGGDGGAITFVSNSNLGSLADINAAGGDGDGAADGTDGVIQFQGDLDIGASSSFGSSVDLGDVTLAAGSDITVAGTLTLGSITGGGFTLDLIVEGLELTDTIAGVTTLHILGANNSESMAFGTDVGGFAANIELLDAEMIFLQGGGVGTLELGDAAWTGNVAFAAGANNAFGLTIEQQNAGGGSIFLGTFGAGAGGVTFSGAVDITGSGATTQIAGVNTAASWTINDALELTASASLISDTAGIEIANTGFAIYGTAADFDLTLQALAGESVTITADGFGDNGAADFEIRNLTIQDDTGNGDITANLSMSGDIAGSLSVDADTALNLNTNGGTFTAGTNMDFDDDVDLDAGTTLVATAGDISFDGTIDGAFDLSLNAGGTVTLSGNVGDAGDDLASLAVTGSTTLGAINIRTTNNIDFNSDVTLIGNVDAVTFAAGGGTIAFDSTIDGTFALSLNGDGGVTLSGNVGDAGDDLASLAVTGSTTLDAINIRTTNNIDFNSDVTLIGNVDAVTFAAGGGTIAFDSTIDGTFALSLNGDGGVTLSGNVGDGGDDLASLAVTGSTTLDAINIRTTNNIDFNSDVTLIGNVDAVTFAAGGGTIAFDSTIDGTFALSLNGDGGVTLSGNVGDAGDDLASLAVTGSTTLDAINIRTTNNIDFNSDVTLIGNVDAVTFAAGGGTIAFDDTIDGTFALSLNGDGGVTLSGNVGDAGDDLASLAVTGSTTLDAINIRTTNNIDFNSDVTLIGNVDAVTFAAGGGTIAFDSTIDGTFALSLNGDGGVTLSGNVGDGGDDLASLAVTGSTTLDAINIRTTNNIDFNSDVTLIGNVDAVTFAAGGGTIAFDSTIDGTFALSLNGDGGVTLSGNVGDGGDDLASLAVTGSTTLDAINIRTTNNIDFNSDVTLIGNVDAVTFAAGGGTIAFDSTIDGTFALSLNGDGGVTLSGNVGDGGDDLASLAVTGSTTLDAINIRTTNNIDFNSDVTLIGNVDAVTFAAGGGTIAFDSTIDGTFALSLNGDGGVTLSDDIGVAGDDLASLDVTGSTTTLDGLTIETQNNIDFNSAVSVTGTTAMTSAAGTIIFDDVVGATGAFDLTVTATNNDVTIQGAATDFTNITLSANGAGALEVNDITGITTDMTLTGNAGITLDGTAYTATDAASVGQILMTGDVTLGAVGVIVITNSGADTEDITFANLLDGANDLTLDAGNLGDVNFNDAVGNGVTLGSMQISNAANVTAASTITADQFIQLDGTATTTFDGAVTTTNPGGVNVVTDTIVVNSTITTTDGGAGGGIVLTADSSGTGAGTLTIANGADFNADDAVTLTGTDGISTGGNIDTTDDNVTFNNAVTLTAGIDIDTTGGAAGNILFNSTIAGGDNSLDLDAGTAGNITLLGDLINGGAFTVRDGAVQNYAVLEVASVLIQDATTSIDFNGIVDTSGDDNAGTDNGGTIAVTSGGTIALHANMDSSGGDDNTATAGAGGTIALTSATGTTIDAGFTVTSAGGTGTGFNGGNGATIDIQSGAGITALGAGALISSAGGNGVAGGNGADINFGADASATTVAAGTVITAAGGTVGGTTATITFSGASTLGTTSDYVGDTIFAGTVTLGDNAVVNVDGDLTIADITGDGFLMTMNVEDLTLGGFITNIPTLTIAGFNDTESIRLGADFGSGFTGDIDIDAGEVVFMDNAGAGITTLVLGDIDADGDVGVSSAFSIGTELPFNLTVTQEDNGVGSIFFGTLANGSGAGTIGIDGSVDINGSGGTIFMSGTNTAADWNINDSIVLNTNVTIIADTGGLIINSDAGRTISGGLGVDRDLTLQANDAQTIEVTSDGFGDAAGNFVRNLLIQANGGNINADLELQGQISGTLTVEDSNGAGQNSLSTDGAAPGTFTADEGMSFANAMVLTADTSLLTDGENTSDISFDDTITGAFDLTVNTGGLGTTTFAGNITNLDTLTTTGSVFLAGVNVTTTGDITFNDTVNLAVGAVNIDAGAGALLFASTITGGQDLTLDGATVDLDGDVGVAPLASLTIDGVTNIAVGVDINTTNNLTFNNTVTLDNGAISMATGGAGVITFAQTLDGSGANFGQLSLTAGNIAFNGVVGATALDSLDVAGDAAIADGITITADNNVDFHNALTVAGSTTITSNSGDVALDSTVTGNNAGTLTVLAANNLTITGLTSDFTTTSLTATAGTASIAGVDVSGDISITGTAVTLTGTDYTTSAGSVALSGPVALSNNVTITSGGGAVQDISFDNIINADDAGLFNRTLSLDAGDDGTISVTGAVGGTQTLAALTIVNSESTQFDAAVTVTDGTGDIVIADTDTGAVTFDGNLTSGTFTAQTSDSAYGVVMNGATNTVSDATLFNNTGTVVLGDNNTDVFNFNGGVTATQPTTVTLQGSLNTDDAIVSIGALVLADAATIDTVNASGGSISIDTITGGNNDLTLISGDQTTSVASTATNIAALTLQEDAVTSTGAVTFSGNLDATSLVTVGNNASYDVSLLGTTTTIDNATTFNNTGTLTLGGAGDTVEFTAGVTATTQGLVNVGGNIDTNTGDMIFGNVTLTDATSFDSGASAMTIANITSDGNAITLESGTTMGIGAIADISGGVAIADAGGQATFNGALGSGVTGDILVNDSNGVDFDGAVNAGTITLTNTTGTVAFNSTLDADDLVTAGNGYNLSLLGDTTIAQQVDMENLGTVTLGDGGDTLTFNGGLSFSGGTNSSLGGTIRSSDDDINFGIGTASLSATTIVDTNGGNLVFGGDITGVANDLTLISQSGTIGVTGAATGLGAVTLQENVATSTGSVTFNGNLTADSLVTFARNYDVSLLEDVTITQATTFNNNSSQTITLGDEFADVLVFAGGLDVAGNATVSMGGQFSTTGGGADFDLGTGATTLSAATTIDTSAGAGTITFGGTLDGTQDLSLTAGLGDIDFDDAVGANADLANILVNSVGSMTSDSTIQASSLIQTTGTGTTTIGGAVTASGAGGINITSDTIAINAGLTTAAGAVTLDADANNAGLGTLTMTADGDVNATGGAVNFTAANGIITAGDVTTAGTTVDYNSATTQSGAVVIDTTNGVAAGANVTFDSTVAGGQNLTIDGGTGGAVLFANDSAVTVNDLTITNAASVSVTGALVANDLITTANAYTVSLTGDGNNTFAQEVDFLNTGLVTIGDETALDNFAFNGGLNFNTGVAGGAASSVAAIITATGDANFGDGGVTLADAGASVTTIGGNIIFGENINGGLDLALDSGAAGTIAVTGITAVDNLVITNSGGAIFTGAVAANTDITITDTTDATTVSFLGAVTANDLVTFGEAYLVSMTGDGNNTFVQEVDFLNTGLVTIGDETALDNFAFNGGLNFNTGVAGGAASSVAAIITATGDANFGDGGVTLADAGASVTTIGGNIIFGENINGGLDLALDSGAAGTIAVTGITTVDNLVITNSGGAIFTGAVAANTDITITDTTDATTVSFLDAVTARDLVTFGEAYLVSMTGTGNTFTADVDFLNTGDVTLGDLAGDTFLFTGGLAFGGGAASNVAADITSVGTAVDFGVGGVALDDASSVTTAGGTITFGGTLDGTQNLTLTAGAGNIDFDGAVGSGAGTELDDILIVSAGNVTADSTIEATSLVQTAGTGITTLDGAVTATGVGGINIAADTIVVNAGMNTTAGAVTFNAGDTLTMTANGDVNATGGAVNFTAANGITTAGDVTTAGTTVDYNSATTQSGAVVIDTTNGVAAGANVTFDSTVAGGQNLTIDGGTGGAVLFDNDSAVTVNDLTIANAASVSVTGALIANDLITTANAYTVSLTGDGNNTFAQEVDFLNTGLVTIGDETALDNFAFNGGLNFNTGAGGAASSVAAIITATGDANFGDGGVTLTDAGASVTTTGNIIFGENINGGLDLALDSGAAGTIAVAGTTTVDNLVITDSGGAIFTGAVAATTDITITDTTDATTVSFLDAVTARDLVTFGEAYLVSMTGTGNTFTQEVDFLNTGDVTLGDLAGDTFLFTGGLVFGGAAASNVAADITSTATDVNFGIGGVQLTANSSVTTGGGNITFGANAAGAAADLLLDAGAAGTISATSMLVNNLEIINSNGATFTGNVQTLLNLTITDTEDGAVVSFQGAVSADDLVTTANGYLVSMTDTGNTFTQEVDFLNTGAVTLGDATTDTFAFDTGLSFTGNAPVNIFSAITTTGDDVNFGGGAATLAGNSTIATTGGDITFGGTLEGVGVADNRTLVLTAGAGDVTFTGVVGGADPENQAIGDTTITAANVTTIDDFAAMSLTVNATGTTLLGGDTSALNDVTINSATITANGNVESDQGNIALAATGVLTHAVGTEVNTLAGTIALTGNTINLGADVNAGGDNNITVTGDTTLTSGVNINTGAGGGDIDFVGLIDGTGLGTESLTLTAGTGDITFTGAVGGVVAVGDTTVVSAANVTTTAGLRAASLTVDATGTTSLTGATQANGDIDIVSRVITAFDDVLSQGGDIDLDADTGALTLTAGTSVATGDGSIALTGTTGINLGANVATDGDVGTVTITGDVTLTDDIGINTSAVDVAGAGDVTVTGDIDEAFGMTMDVEGDLSITGDVGSATALSSITGLTTGDVDVSGTIDSTGNISFDADGDLEFGGNLTAGGDITLETGSVGTIAFEAAVTDVTAVGDIVLSNAVVSATTVPAIATITSESTTGITFDAGGDFTMTAGEKLTTFGDLTITTGANGTASLGDLVTIGDIRVTADTINFISRNAGDVLNADGTTTEDQGIDVVASGQFFFSVAPGLTGGLRPVHFASNTVGADALGTLDAWIVRWTDSSITLNSIVNGTTILDLAADGIDSLNNFEVAELAGAIRPMSTMTPIVILGHDTFKDDGNGDDGEDDEETTIQEASIR